MRHDTSAKATLHTEMLTLLSTIGPNACNLSDLPWPMVCRGQRHLGSACRPGPTVIPAQRSSSTLEVETRIWHAKHNCGKRLSPLPNPLVPILGRRVVELDGQVGRHATAPAVQRVLHHVQHPGQQRHGEVAVRPDLGTLVCHSLQSGGPGEGKWWLNHRTRSQGADPTATLETLGQPIETTASTLICQSFPS